MELRKCTHRNCGNFYAVESSSVTRKYCSKRCQKREAVERHADRGGNWIPTQAKCGNERCANFFTQLNPHAKYCSNRCRISQGSTDYRKRYPEVVKERGRLWKRKEFFSLSDEERQKRYRITAERNRKRYNALSYEERQRIARERYANCDKKRKLERTLEYRREKYQQDKVFKMRTILRSRFRRVLLDQGADKSQSVIKLIGCTIEELRAHIEAQFEPWMTWDNWEVHGWHIDHIKPCAAFDLTDPEQQRECFHYTNLRPLACDENWQKADKY